MDHEEAVRQKSTERYLLDELEPEARDEFEDHLFDCQDCALDLRAATMFVEQSKVVLAEKPVTTLTAAPEREKRSWLGWLRPSFAAPLLALLLAVVGYQNLVTLPRVTEAENQLQSPPWTSVNLMTRGAAKPVIKVAPGGAFLLFVNLPRSNDYSSYIADLYDPAGKLESSLEIPVESAGDAWPLRVPAMTRKAGTYTLVVRGTKGSAPALTVGSSPFELQVEK
jgi:hypothetical protein